MTGFASDRLIPVVIYEGGDLNHVTGTPSWIPGLFDGKIRLDSELLASGPMLEGLLGRQVLPDLRELSGGYSSMTQDRAELAYRQAYWMSRDLVDMFGWEGVAWFLGRLEGDPRAPFDQAFQESFGEVPQVYLDRWYDDWLGRG